MSFNDAHTLPGSHMPGVSRNRRYGFFTKTPPSRAFQIYE